MIDFVDRVGDLTPSRLRGFFAGWPARPTPEQHLAALRGSYRVVLAVDDRGQVVGFISAISDGVATAFIPWLEVLPEHRGRGIGSELVRRMLATLDHMYSVDLVCDADLRGFYQRLGLRPLQGMGIRNPAVLTAEVASLDSRHGSG
jgi:ribosomal protein S18 acetylase RimI-like enzyme